MPLAIIADDLTGANDTGVQLAVRGIEVVVYLRELDGEALAPGAVAVFDTDSRAMAAEAAYAKVWSLAAKLRGQGFDTIYKKIDSLLRGNVGAEIDAVYDAFAPELVVIAPAYPHNGRTVADGRVYVNGVPLHETEAARDPVTPVTDAFVPAVLAKQSRRQAAVIGREELAAPPETFAAKLAALRADGFAYVVADAEDDRDLAKLVEQVGRTGLRTVWVGSAGLARHVDAAVAPAIAAPPVDAVVSPSTAAPPVDAAVAPAIAAPPVDAAVAPAVAAPPLAADATQASAPGPSRPAPSPALLVVGSVSPRARQQLAVALRHPAVAGVRFASHAAAGDDAAMRAEIERASAAAIAAWSAGSHVVLYAAGEADDIRMANEAGSRRGLDAQAVSRRVGEALGAAAATVVRECGVAGLVASGGDAAKQVCAHLGVSGIRLYGEVESGVPIGKMLVPGVAGSEAAWIVTKAGSFGADDVFVHAIAALDASSAQQRR